jgi:hypothetical protein
MLVWHVTPGRGSTGQRILISSFVVRSWFAPQTAITAVRMFFQNRTPGERRRLLWALLQPAPLRLHRGIVFLEQIDQPLVFGIALSIGLAKSISAAVGEGERCSVSDKLTRVPEHEPRAVMPKYAHSDGARPFKIEHLAQVVFARDAPRHRNAGPLSPAPSEA